MSVPPPSPHDSIHVRDISPKPSERPGGTSQIIADHASEPSHQEKMPAANQRTADAQSHVGGHQAAYVFGTAPDRPAPPASEQPTRKQAEEKLLGVPTYQTQPQYSGNRTYNYEEKYPPDELGKEAEPEARVWRMYLDEAESYDDDMMRSFRDTIDSLLVLAALFAAIVATLLAQTSLALKQDYTQLSFSLMVEQVQLLRAAGNVTEIMNIVPSGIDRNTTTVSTADIWINGLFFTSLALTLAAALFAVLIKQWLQAYMSLAAGSAMDRALTRQFRFDGLKKWKLSIIVNALPLLLHTAFALFLAGLSVFVYDLRPSLSWIIILVTIISFGVYIGSVFVPAIWLECPYRIPLLFRAARATLWLPTFMKYFIRHIQAALSSREKPILPQVSIPSLRAAEKEALKVQSFPFKWEEQAIWTLRDTMVCQSLSWLYSLSANDSIHRVVTHAFHGIITSDYSPLTSEPFVPWRTKDKFSILLASLPIPSLFDLAWKRYQHENEDPPSHPTSCPQLWLKILNILRSASLDSSISKSPVVRTALGDNTSPVTATQNLSRLCKAGKVELARMMLGWGADVNALDDAGHPPLYSASHAGNMEIVTLLVEKRANLNVVAGKYGTALQAASVAGHVEVVRLLVNKGADVNAVGGYYGTALQAASTEGPLEVVELLLDNGAGVDVVAGQYGTALQGACVGLGDRLNVVKLLFDRGAEISLVAGEYGTPILAVCYVGVLPILEFLVKKGADIDAVVGENPTALQSAAYMGNWDVVKFLVEHDADVNLQGGQYGNALAAAVKGREHDIAEFLRARGAKELASE